MLSGTFLFHIPSQTEIDSQLEGEWKLRVFYPANLRASVTQNMELHRVGCHIEGEATCMRSREAEVSPLLVSKPQPEPQESSNPFLLALYALLSPMYL